LFEHLERERKEIYANQARVLTFTEAIYTETIYTETIYTNIYRKINVRIKSRF